MSLQDHASVSVGLVGCLCRVQTFRRNMMPKPLQPRRSTHYIPPKCKYTAKMLYGATTHKTTIYFYNCVLYHYLDSSWISCSQNNVILSEA
jgi:hypothetical protein